MKKLTFLVAAFLLAGTSFAQTTSASQEHKTQTTHGTAVSTTAHTELTADATGKGETVREVAKAKSDKTREKKEKTAKAVKEETKARKAETRTLTQESQEAAAQARAERKAQAETRKTTREKKATQIEAEAKVKTNANLKAARPDHDNHGETVRTVAKETVVTGQEKGQLVKEAASEKRQRAGRIDTQTSATTKTHSSSARRRTKVSTGTTAKPVKPVKVNASANLKAGK